MTQHTHTTYIPIWYTPENVAKYKNTAESVSRQINIDKISPLLRLNLVALDEVHGEYELELLSKAESYGLKVPYIDAFSLNSSNKQEVDFGELEYLVLLYEYLDEEGLELAERARNWYMPIKEYHLKDIYKLRFEIEDYEKQLDEASTLWIGWETDTYDPQGLAEAIAEAKGEAEEDHRNYIWVKNSVYRAGRGV
jgi:hypothetical protein